MAGFYEARGSGHLFKLLLKEDAGGWLISYDEPAAPFLVHWPALEEQYIRAQTPLEYEKYACDAASTLNTPATTVPVGRANGAVKPLK